MIHGINLLSAHIRHGERLCLDSETGPRVHVLVIDDFAIIRWTAGACLVYTAKGPIFGDMDEYYASQGHPDTIPFFQFSACPARSTATGTNLCLSSAGHTMSALTGLLVSARREKHVAFED
jgi:hypothetical protein